MAGRPRLATNKEILSSAAKVINRVGPTRMTLADVGKEVGLRASTLIQRFGSKRGLLLALTEEGAQGVTDNFNQAKRTSDPLKAITSAYVLMCSGIKSPAELANNIAFLQIDLTDPEFHAIARRQKSAVLQETAKLLQQVAAEGQWKLDIESAASVVYALYSGTLLAWAIDGEGSLQVRVARTIDGYLLMLGVQEPEQKH